LIAVSVVLLLLPMLMKKPAFDVSDCETAAFRMHKGVARELLEFYTSGAYLVEHEHKSFDHGPCAARALRMRWVRGGG
jgi:hypothetical protein